MGKTTVVGRMGSPTAGERQIQVTVQSEVSLEYDPGPSAQSATRVIVSSGGTLTKESKTKRLEIVTATEREWRRWRAYTARSTRRPTFIGCLARRRRSRGASRRAR